MTNGIVPYRFAGSLLLLSVLLGCARDLFISIFNGKIQSLPHFQYENQTYDDKVELISCQFATRCKSNKWQNECFHSWSFSPILLPFQQLFPANANQFIGGEQHARQDNANDYYQQQVEYQQRLQQQQLQLLQQQQQQLNQQSNLYTTFQQPQQSQQIEQIGDYQQHAQQNLGPFYQQVLTSVLCTYI